MFRVAVDDRAYLDDYAHADVDVPAVAEPAADGRRQYITSVVKRRLHQHGFRERVLDAYPNTRVTCLDLAENMIEMAKAKLSQHPHTRFLVGDLNTFDFDATYDVVVSSLALHHLVTDEDKCAFYARIHDALAPGGAFYNADVVLGSGEALQTMYMRKWQAFMRQNVSQDEMENTWLPKYYDEDRPAPLVDQMARLTEIGFADVDVVWKYYNYAVYGGTKI